MTTWTCLGEQEGMLVFEPVVDFDSAVRLPVTLDKTFWIFKREEYSDMIT